MKTELYPITIGEIYRGFKDAKERGVKGYGGRLNIRPSYQREFIYGLKQSRAVIETVLDGCTLSSMFWGDVGGGDFELLDGQQRTMAICSYLSNDYTFKDMFFHNQPREVQERILGYKLLVFVCEGSPFERLQWYRKINVAGEPHKPQELLNATYTGRWLESAKSQFSRSGCPAQLIGGKYLRGDVVRQDYLATALDWVSSGDAVGYMAKHQHSEDASELWAHFMAVLRWVVKVFPTYREEMRGVNYGKLYAKYKDLEFDAAELSDRIAELYADDDVGCHSGIYEYVLGGDAKCLSLRSFTKNQKARAYAKQYGFCACCSKSFDFATMHGDHLVPWVDGGKTVDSNLQLLCSTCNTRKGRTPGANPNLSNCIASSVGGQAAAA